MMFVFTSFALLQDDNCVWRDPESALVYDLSPLHGDNDIHLTETLNGVDVEVFAAICGVTKQRCKGERYPAVVLALGDCFPGGTAASEQIEATPTGLTLTFSQGAECDAFGNRATSRAVLECEPRLPGGGAYRVAGYAQRSMCEASVTIRTPAACAVPPACLETSCAASLNLLGDGRCDTPCNTSACLWDRGDCRAQVAPRAAPTVEHARPWRGCFPGATATCACADGRVGAQRCADSGKAFRGCECTAPAAPLHGARVQLRGPQQPVTLMQARWLLQTLLVDPTAVAACFAAALLMGGALASVMLLYVRWRAQPVAVAAIRRAYVG